MGATENVENISVQNMRDAVKWFREKGTNCYCGHGLAMT